MFNLLPSGGLPSPNPRGILANLAANAASSNEAAVWGVPFVAAPRMIVRLPDCDSVEVEGSGAAIDSMIGNVYDLMATGADPAALTEGLREGWPQPGFTVRVRDDDLMLERPGSAHAIGSGMAAQPPREKRYKALTGSAGCVPVVPRPILVPA